MTAQALLCIRSEWDETQEQTEGLHPPLDPAVLIDWYKTPRPLEGGVPPSIVSILCELLVGQGSVGFRWKGPPTWPAGQARLVEAPKAFGDQLPGALSRLFGLATSLDVAITDSPLVAACLFDAPYANWGLQNQAAIILDRAAGSWHPSLSILHAGIGWEEFQLAPPLLGLLVPAVDGDAAVLAYHDEPALDRVVGALTEIAEAAGARVTRHDARGR